MDKSKAERRKSGAEIIRELQAVEIKGWDDLSGYLDKLSQSSLEIQGESSRALYEHFDSFEAFLKHIHKGIAIISFSMRIDGVTVEMVKYARALSSLCRNNSSRSVNIHWIGGNFEERSSFFSSPDIKKLRIEGMDGFEKWGELYFALFRRKLRRGTPEYRRLPKALWEYTLSIATELIEYFEKNSIRLMLLTNTNSIPGNLALSLALVIVSEKMNIPVINSNHDFYWEELSHEPYRYLGASYNLSEHFFINSDISEFFSLIDLLYPWKSRKWLQANINRIQSEALAFHYGVSPAQIDTLTTAVDTELYRPHTAKEKAEIRKRLTRIISGGRSAARTIDPDYIEFPVLQPVVIGRDAGIKFAFDADTILLLQPTRISRNKNIEKDIELIEELLTSKTVVRFLDKNPRKKIVLHITGALAPGNEEYLREIQSRILEFYTTDPIHSERVFFVFNFGSGIESFLPKTSGSVLVSELYAISNLVLLPSEVEGRGLPLIESAAAGVPIACSRYSPEEAFVDVVGENRPEDEQIHYIEFPKNGVSKIFLKEVFSAVGDEKRRRKIAQHNAGVVQKRFSHIALIRNFDRILRRMWNEVREMPRETAIALNALNEHSKISECPKGIIYAKNRAYIPGYHKLGRLSYLRSLLDPHYFRVEERDARGRLHKFASGLIDETAVADEPYHLFYRSLERLFLMPDDRERVRDDSSLSERYRGRGNRRYEELTEQELMGKIVGVAEKVFKELPPELSFLSGESVHIANRRALSELRLLGQRRWLELLGELPLATKYRAFGTGSGTKFPVSSNEEAKWAIDNREWFLEEVLSHPTCLIHFCDGAGEIVFDMKILAEKLLLHWERISEEGKTGGDYCVTFVVRANRFENDITLSDIHYLLYETEFRELRRFFIENKFRVVPSGSVSAGTNLKEASHKLYKAILEAKEKGGCATARGIHNYFTLDLLDLPSYRFGRVSDLPAALISGMQVGSYFFQFVPPGIRTTIAHPVATQGSFELDEALSSQAFYEFLAKHRKNPASAFEILKSRLDEKPLTLSQALKRLAKRPVRHKKPVEIDEFAGRHSDGETYTGVAVELDAAGLQKLGWRPAINYVTSNHPLQTLPALVKKFLERTRDEILFALNGGCDFETDLSKANSYNFSESRAMKMVVENGRIISPPLIPAPALAMTEKGVEIISSASLENGGEIFAYDEKDAVKIKWERGQVNPDDKLATRLEVALYDARRAQTPIPLSGRAILCVAGDRIEKVFLLDKDGDGLEGAVGATPSILVSTDRGYYETKLKRHYKAGVRVEMKLNLSSSGEIISAVQAGPLLMEGGKQVFERLNEIERLRRPRIAFGIGRNGRLVCVAVNGRLRDSVGATWEETAAIMASRGCESALGFQSGESATLFAGGEVLNIQAYNEDFQESPYRGKSQAKKISDAIIISRVKRRRTT
ncbi:MAG: hypothetical protein Kow0090_14000 [Myxococcota bacterium]